MKVYLDNCAFNRPFDDQRQVRIRLESEAKLHLQSQIQQGKVELIWSYILKFENDANPFAERKYAIEMWQSLASIDIVESATLLATAKKLTALGIKPKDALHVSSAIEGSGDYFVTTDDRLLKKLKDTAEIQAVNPVDIVGIIDKYDY